MKQTANNTNNNNFIEILTAAAEAGLTEDLKGALYLQALAARPDDQRLMRSIQGRIQRAVMAQSMNKSLFQVPRDMAGDFHLGNHPGGAAEISFPALTSHLLQVGGSGAGKTCNFLFWLCQAFSLSGGVWVFDFFKREFRDLAPIADGMGEKVFVLRWQDFPFNPLEVPEKVNPMEWANTVSDLFTSTLAVPPAARNILRSALVGIYRERGIENGGKDYPTLRELAEAIRGIKAHDASRQAILGRIDALLDVAGNMLNHRKGLPLGQLERVNCIFELDGLALIYQNFLAACLLSGAFSRRVAANDNRSPLLVSLDEGQRLYSRSAASSVEGPSFITLMTSLVRATQIMLLVGVQTTDDLSRTIMSNSATKILGRCGDLEDYNRMGRSMGLDAQQIEWCKVSLRPGLFVAKLTYGENQHPFLLQMPLVKLTGRVSDADVAASGQALRNFLGWRPEEEPPRVVEAASASTPASDLSDDEKELLEAVFASPYRPSSQIAPELGISQRKALKLRKSLCKKEYLREWKIDIDPRGSMVLLVPLKTVEGKEVIKQTTPGRGGPLHYFGLGAIEATLKSDGWKVRREVCLPAGGDEKTFIDLVAECDGEEARFIELELRPDYAVTNIRKAFFAGAKQVESVTTTRVVAKAIKRAVEKDLLPEERGCLSISMLSSFLPVR